VPENDAQLFMDGNKALYREFKIMNLIDPAQAHRKEAIKEFIARELIISKLESNPTRALEAALEIAKQQSMSHFAKVDTRCVEAPELRLKVMTLFHMIRSKPTILPFNPAVAIDRRILNEWTGSFE
jgi:hypothetical protein